MTAVKNEAVLGCPLVVRRRMTHTAPESHPCRSQGASLGPLRNGSCREAATVGQAWAGHFRDELRERRSLTRPEGPPAGAGLPPSLVPTTASLPSPGSPLQNLPSSVSRSHPVTREEGELSLVTHSS